MSATENINPHHGSAARPGANLRFWVSWRRRVIELGLAILSGLLLSAAFPPIEAGGMVWIAFIPLLLLPIPHLLGRRVLIGYVFGLAHFVSSLWWLNEIGFAAGILLSFVCAVFPMGWYLLFAAFANSLPELQRQPSRGVVLPRHIFQATGLHIALGGLLLGALWVALEWIRSWLFTGFSWNQLGVSQWQHPLLLRLTAFTGVYGISFLIVLTNVVLGWLVTTWLARFRGQQSRRGIPWPPLVAIICFAPILLMPLLQQPLDPPDRYLRVAGIQGNLSQRREFTPGQLTEAIEVYKSLSLRALESVRTPPDLIVWPETALPASLNDERVSAMVGSVLHKAQTQMLIGSLAWRLTGDPETQGEKAYSLANSALLLSPAGQIVDYYDKIHRVPFGEYVPFGQYLPWLVEFIGMGRDLLAGTEYTVFNLPQGARGGVNICYEDAYPGISRAFVRKGANLLLTLTNDAWYAESAGSRQHMTHAVLRAAENRRPLFRSGNNSDTCLIWPSGKVEGLLHDPVTQSRFVRGYRIYDVPVWDALPLTVYTKYGDWFAKSCALVMLAAVFTLATLHIRRKRQLFEAITGSQS